jgi:hypothetical protein
MFSYAHLGLNVTNLQFLLIAVFWPLISHFSIYIVQEEEMGGACGTHADDENCIQNFGRDT